MVTSKDFQDPNESIEQVLQRKVPGVLVTRTGDGGIALQIRGVSSYNGAVTPPLYVLNGVTFHPGPGGALTGINPHDIESIKVLKGAEAGLYGIEGANGVIVITTKQPGKRSP
jgi:TonB-dependent SusC/RagA subfamily outer membrane receptor